MSEKVKGILDAIGELNLLELKELIDGYKEKFGVEAVMAAPAAVAAAAGGAAEEEKEEKTLFAVFLESVGEKKVPVIKAIRQILPLGLKEAKEFVDSVEQGAKEIKADVSKEEAEKIKGLLEEAGAVVSVK